jgi:CIC family chloride channel protein
MHKISLRRRHQALLCFFAVLIGGLASVIARLLILSIHFFTNIFYFQKFSFGEAQPDPQHLGWISVFIPVIGGLLVGLMARFGSKAIRGHGIPEAMEQILSNESRIHPQMMILKPLSSAISIGSGGPFGAEGPIIATGGALGSWLGQIFPMTAFERKVLLSCGAAAGMTAIFGTPLAAVLLAIELLLFEYRAQSFTPVALSAVVASVLRSTFWSSDAFLSLPALGTLTLTSLPVYLFSGVLFGLLAIFITKTVYWIEDLFEKLPIHWMWWPMIGGLVVGLVGLWEPRSLGVGYSNIQIGLDGRLTIVAALTLAFWKFCSWAVALGSGTSGGTLAPLLTFGSLSGAALGLFLQNFLPDLHADIHVLALVGMAAVFAGCSRAMLASVVFALEATREPAGLVPLLGACALSHLVSHWFMKNSIMTEKIVRRGVSVPSEYVPHAP